ncbi:methylenetetrahydrofolate reductase (NADPH),mmuM, BHMT2; homocysteine S-methyltransferase [Methylacidimicrobium cyclopophantes]|uniref:Methylenetetrahydrofolate reductase (NADPH),mmuM, BHMT2 homocysteine S-methyltransferase n=1 Tax=Methylacidimicrobium cyclopophantes TaxID=1041766 RepID=A0A5E6MM47_9BACT|nr:bifunctional homocysteine S-methyltransferase/methylenetetrahydrofolate reductase [Methylacidimicrobium cyclopophantes]VVM07139.1 methylenetetrahydrofolate reductase (NADPH),mmuM, BHMT2; homocysteine S-methyltransferase [Methylacidimicrobium cyclopophantes]
MANLLELLSQRLVLGDGALGTYLYTLGLPRRYCLEEANLSRPELVQRAHADYRQAGAELLRTNTTGANRASLSRFGLEGRVVEINRRGVELARAAAGGGESLIAGSVGPIWLRPWDGSLSPEERRTLYQEQISALLDAGCDLVFLETFTELPEAMLALRVAREAGSPIVAVSLAVFEEGRLGNGETLASGLAALWGAGAGLVGIGGSCGILASLHLLEGIEVRAGEFLCAFPNAGKPEFYEGRLTYSASPKYFAASVDRFVEEGVHLLGGDYGTSPLHIAAMAPILARHRPRFVKAARARLSVVEAVREEAPPGTREESLLDRCKRKPVAIVELDSPRTLAMDKFLEGVRALEKAGADALTLADNSLAILRVSNLAAAVAAQRCSRLHTVLHLACRDRNLLGLQSELLGMSVLGFRHVLALTGDPAKAGDHPGATSVYDLNSLGLIKLLAKLNSGVSAAGRDLKAKTDFVIGCAFNPNSVQFDSQVRKLESKIAAGAQFTMTQPVFDAERIRKSAERLKPLGIPVFVGVMPVLNSRNAEFLHNEVPGISIPEGVRERLRHLEGPKAAEVGLELARSLAETVLECFGAVYLITPFLRYDLSVRLLEELF